MRLELGVSCVWELGVRVNLCARLENEHPHTRGATSRQRGPRCGTLGAAHAWRPVDPQMQLSDAFHDSHGICLPPYQNTIGEQEPSIWAGPCEPNFHSYGGWCPVSYGILVGGRLLPWVFGHFPGTNHHSCENWVQAVQPIYLVPAHLWYSGRGVGIYHRNRRTRQKMTFGGLRASMHDMSADRQQDAQEDATAAQAR